MKTNIANSEVNIKLQVSRQFLDSRELGNSPKSLANLHNNQVGWGVGAYLIFVTDTTDGVCVKKNCPV